MDELRDHLADFEDVWRPIKSYFFWEKHCYDIPICFSLKSIFDVIDGVDAETDKLFDLVKDLDQMDALLPQLLQQFPTLIATAESTRTMILTMHSTMSGFFSEMDDMTQNVTAMGQAFDAAKNDDSFYLPPETFPERGLPARDEFLPVSGRESSSIHHFAKGRSRDARAL